MYFSYNCVRPTVLLFNYIVLQIYCTKFYLQNTSKSAVNHEAIFLVFISKNFIYIINLEYFKHAASQLWPILSVHLNLCYYIIEESFSISHDPVLN